MTECRHHQGPLYRFGERLGFRTLRCAHYGNRYVHERISDDPPHRWMNLNWGTSDREPILVVIDLNGDDVMWNILVSDMMDDHA